MNKHCTLCFQQSKLAHGILPTLKTTAQVQPVGAQYWHEKNHKHTSDITLRAHANYREKAGGFSEHEKTRLTVNQLSYASFLFHIKPVFCVYLDLLTSRLFIQFIILTTEVASKPCEYLSHVYNTWFTVSRLAVKRMMSRYCDLHLTGPWLLLLLLLLYG